MICVHEFIVGRLRILERELHVYFVLFFRWIYVQLISRQFWIWSDKHKYLFGKSSRELQPIKIFGLIVILRIFHQNCISSKMYGFFFFPQIFPHNTRVQTTCDTTMTKSIFRTKWVFRQKVFSDKLFFRRLCAIIYFDISLNFGFFVYIAGWANKQSSCRRL